MKRNLLIKDVDLELLEGQRKFLNGILHRIDTSYDGIDRAGGKQVVGLSRPEMEALTGIENMLNHWSDNRLPGLKSAGVCAACGEKGFHDSSCIHYAII